MDCQKCGDRKSFEWAERSVLIGGYHTRLCLTCNDAWHAFITTSPLWNEMETLKDRAQDIMLAAYGKDEPTEKLAPIRARLREIDAAMYDLGKSWVSERVAQPASVDAVDPHATSTGKPSTRDKSI